MQFLGSTLASSVVIGLQVHFDINLIYRSYGVMILLFSVVVVIGLTEKVKSNQNENQTVKVPLKVVMK
jgi:hypothetical protein